MATSMSAPIQILSPRYQLIGVPGQVCSPADLLWWHLVAPVVGVCAAVCQLTPWPMHNSYSQYGIVSDRESVESNGLAV